jgi:rRNA maturation RNase YbeY
MAIEFFEEDISLPENFQIAHTITWLETIAKHHQVEIKELNYIFCSDDYLLEINKTHLNHDYYTDIITFPYGDHKKISGDIFISLDRVNDNALQFKVEKDEELKRVISHGLLHLIGFKDKTEEEAKVMREKENEAIEMYQ